MLKQINALLKAENCNFLGINEARYCKDKKEKKRLMGLFATFIILIVFMIGYAAGIAYGLVSLNLANLIPTYLSLIIVVMSLFVTLFRTGPTLYNIKTYDQTISLPLKPETIIISRFLSLYITNILFSLLIMIPGMIVYGIAIHPTLVSYILSIFVAMILPLIAMTIGMIVGTLIYGISSKMKYKSLATTIISLVFAIVMIVLPLLLINSSLDDLTYLSSTLQNVLLIVQRILIPLKWAQTTIDGTSYLSLLWLILLCLIPFALFTIIIGRFFESICSSLRSSFTKNNFKMLEQTRSSVLSSLLKKEAKRYFSCSIYVTNTIIGSILAVGLSIALFFVNTESILQTIGANNINFYLIIAFLVSSVFSLSPASTSSLSIEGKNIWIIKSLPVDNQTIIKAKVLFTLILEIPFYVIAEILMFIAIKPSGLNIIWIILIPLLGIIFSDIAGLAANIKFPLLNWSSEITPVKQSKAVLIGILASFVTDLIPLGFIFTGNKIIAYIVPSCWLVILTALSIFLYIKIQKVKLNDIE